jgi:3',5'-nucleoside bisphosphate phosphatase
MPARAPFTRLCQALAGGVPRGRADLHLHSTASDGRYTPAQLVDLARRTGLSALAVTDHDTLQGITPARAAAAEGLEVVSGVEISASWIDREVHLLGFFFDHCDTRLNEALDRLRVDREDRYREMVARLKGCGAAVDDEDRPAPGTAWGRRHLAGALVRAGQVGTLREAFNRYLDEGRPAFVEKALVPLPEAVRLVRGAGGVTSYAHPGNELDRAAIVSLRDVGLQAVEVEYPGFRASRTAELRRWAGELGMAVTGGSDCHGPDEPRRAVGARTISDEELEVLRGLAAGK